MSVDANVVEPAVGEYVDEVAVAVAAEVVAVAEVAVVDEEARIAGLSKVVVAGIASGANPAEIVLGMPEQKRASQIRFPARCEHQYDRHHEKPAADALLGVVEGTESLYWPTTSAGD